MNDTPGAFKVYAALMCVKVASVPWSSQLVCEMTQMHSFGGGGCGN